MVSIKWVLAVILDSNTGRPGKKDYKWIVNLPLPVSQGRGVVNMLE